MYSTNSGRCGFCQPSPATTPLPSETLQRPRRLFHFPHFQGRCTSDTSPHAARESSAIREGAFYWPLHPHADHEVRSNCAFLPHALAYISPPSPTVGFLHESCSPSSLSFAHLIAVTVTPLHPLTRNALIFINYYNGPLHSCSFRSLYPPLCRHSVSCGLGEARHSQWPCKSKRLHLPVHAMC